MPARAPLLPAAGPCETCAAVRSCTRGTVALYHWCQTGRGPWLGAAEHLARLAAAGVTVRVYVARERAAAA